MSGVLGEGDIEEMLEDLAEAQGAVEVTLGAYTVTGLFDRAAVQIFDGDMPTIVPDGETVHVKAGSLPGLAPDAALVVDGVAYRVNKVLPYGDGAMIRVELTRTE